MFPLLVNTKDNAINTPVSFLKELNRTAMKTKREDKVYYIIGLSFTTGILAMVLVIAILGNYPDPIVVGINKTIGDTSDQFITQITPSDWAYTIWFPLILWQGAWVVYGWTLVCRSTVPRIISKECMICYSSACLCIIEWVYIWSNQLPQYAFSALTLGGILLYLAIGFESVYLYKITEELKKSRKSKIDLYATRILVINGIAFFATWLTVQIFINFAIILEYHLGVSPTNAGTTSLMLMLLTILGYFNLEIVLLDSVFRYVITVYPTIVWAYSAIIDAHWGQSHTNSALTLITLILGLILFILKIASVIFFYFARPINYSNKIIKLNVSFSLPKVSIV